MVLRLAGRVRASPNRIALVAALTLLTGAFGLVSGAGLLSTVAGPAHASHPIGGSAQLSAAKLSLSRGDGPAVILVSPGGYGWHNVTGALTAAPSGRLASLAWDASDGYVLLYGWLNVGGGLADTWSFSNGTWTNLTASVTGVPAVGLSNQFATMGYDPSTAKIIVFLPYISATWSYHAKTWTNITATSGAQPPRAIGVGFTTDTTDNELVFQGGQLISGSLSSTATWTFKAGVWTNISSLSPFSFGKIVLPVLADDPPDHGVLAFAISEWGSMPHPSSFLFSGGVWSNLTPSAGIEPAPSLLPAIGYLPSIAAVVLSEGIAENSTGSSLNVQSTWEYANHVWTNLTALTGPQPTNGAVASGAVDPVDGTWVLFGGERFVGPVVYPGTWIFSAPPKVTASASRTVIDASQSVTFTSTALGTAPVTVSWNFGDSTTGTGLSASHTYGAAGVYTSWATATDFVGATGTAVVSIEVNPALAVTANGTPTSGTAGAWETLQSTVTGGTAPLTYAWTLGDGSTSTAGSLGHVYANAGSFVVNVTVTDATGATAKASFTEVVKAAPSTSTGSVSVTSGTGLYLLIGLALGWVLAIAFLAMWAMGRKGRSGPPQAYNAGGSGAMGTPPSGGPPPGVGGSPPPPGM